MIPHNKPTIGNLESTAAAQVIKSGFLVKGEQITAFENEICAFLGLPPGHALCVSSGSSALFIAMKVLNLENKRIAMPSYVCSSLKHACHLNNSIGVYLDNKAELPLPKLSNQQVDALVHPYLFGLASHLPSSTTYPVIEDLAQALGASTSNGMLGTLGTISVLSFYATKMMTTGGHGGMIVSKNKALIDEARDYIYFDQPNDDKNRFNFQLTEIQAAIGRVQLRRLPEFIKKREERWQIYKDAGLPLMNLEGAGLNHVRYRAIVKTLVAKSLLHNLNKQKIMAINPFDENELLAPECGNARNLCNQTVSLPLYPTLSIKNTRNIAKITSELLERL